jgi:hypothetical protein
MISIINTNRYKNPKEIQYTIFLSDFCFVCIFQKYFSVFYNKKNLSKFKFFVKKILYHFWSKNKLVIFNYIKGHFWYFKNVEIFLFKNILFSSKKNP